MLMKAWLSALQRQLQRTPGNRGLRARRRGETASNRLVTTEKLEERSLLTALVVDADNLSDFTLPNEGLRISNADLVGFDALVISQVAIGGVDGDAIDIDLTGITLRSLTIDTVSVADPELAGIDINLDAITGLETIAIEDTSATGQNVGIEITLNNDTDVDGLTIDDTVASGVRIQAFAGSDIGHGVIIDSSIAGGVGIEGVLLEMDSSNADNFTIINNPRISSLTRDAILIDVTDAPQDGLTIRDNDIGATAPVSVDFVVDGDTFSQPFSITNTSTGGDFLTRLFIDIEPAGLVFDQDPTTGFPFTPANGTELTTGLNNVIVTETTLEILFDDFGPGETFDWNIDLDLATTQSSVFGDDLIGSLVDIDFTGGKSSTGVMIGVPQRPDASQFSQGAGGAGANGIHVMLDASPATNLTIEDNEVQGTPGSSLLIEADNRSDISAVIQRNEFLASGSDGAVFRMTDSNFQGAVVNNNISNHDGNGLLFEPIVSRSGRVERISGDSQDRMVITTSNHGLLTGEEITLQGVTDDDPDVIHGANGRFTITRIDNNRFSLNGTDGTFNNFLYDGGGTWFVPEFMPDGTSRGLVSIDLQGSLPTGFVQAATNASPIVITSTRHGLTTGDTIRVSNVNGNTAANGVHAVTVLDANRFLLVGSTGNGDFDPTEGLGRWTGNVVTDASDTDEIIITAPGYDLESGDEVRITGVLGNTAANGTHRITRIDADRFKLRGVEGNGAYLGDGNWTPIKDLTFNGDVIPQVISGNSFTSNVGTGIETILSTGTIFRGDVVRNQFAQNIRPGLNIESTSYGLGQDLPLDPLDPAAVPGAQDISFNVMIGSENQDDGNVFDFNGETGVRLQAFDAGTGSFEIRNNTITNTVDRGNPLFTGDGIHVRLEGSQADAEAVALLAESTVDNNTIGVDNQGNDGPGMVFSMEERTRIQDLNYTNNTVINNGDDGFTFRRRDDADLNNVDVTKNTFENNAGDGADFLAQNTTRDLLDFSFDENEITNNRDFGIRIEVLADARVEVNMENNTVDRNGRGGNGYHPNDTLGNTGASGGIGFRAFQNVDILMNMTGNRINDNIGDGLSVDAQNFFDQLRVIGDWRDNEFSRNTLSGFRNNGIATGRFHWENNAFTDNLEDGARSVSLIDFNDFFERRVGGRDIDIFGINNQFTGNSANGLHLGQGVIATFGDGTVPNANDFSSNGEDGLKITQGAGHYLFNEGKRRVITTDRNFFTDNGEEGIDIGQFAATEGGNVEHGDEVVTQTDVTITNAIITRNGGDGVEYLADNLPRVLPVVGSGQDNDLYRTSAVSSLTISESSIRRNDGRGVDILNRVDEDSRVNVINNDILSNGLSGVYVVNSASRFQVQEGPDDPLDIANSGSWPVERDSNDILVISRIDTTPRLELRVQDNEIESNGTDQITSTVTVAGSSEVGDDTGIPQNGWAESRRQIPGTLGGLVVRVGTVSAPTFYNVVQPEEELGFFAGVDAEVFRNAFNGNFGTEVYFDNFTSVLPTHSASNFDCNDNPRFLWNGSRDAVSRFDLVFRENSGNSLDVTSGYAHLDNWEPEFKSRVPGVSAPVGHTHNNDPDGPHTPGAVDGRDRKRNGTRTLGWTEFDFWEMGQATQDWPTDCNDPMNGAVLTVPNPAGVPLWAFDGEGTSTWRVESDFETDQFDETDPTQGYSDFFTIVELGDSAKVGEQDYQWDTGVDAPGFNGATPYSLSRGDIFNVRNGEDPIEADSLEQNDSFLAATDLGVVSGALSVNTLATDNLLTIETKGDRDYYKMIAAASGNLGVRVDAVDTAGSTLQFLVYEFDPDRDTEEIPLRTAPDGSPIREFVFPGAARTLNFPVLAGRTYIIEVLSTEASNAGFNNDSFFYGTTRNYLLDINAPSNFSGGGGGGGGGNQGGGGGTGGGEGGNGGNQGGGGSLPGDPFADIVDVTPDPRSTGTPEVHINFTEDVTGFDITDLVLTRNGQTVSLINQTLTQVNGACYILDLTEITNDRGTYVLTLVAADSEIIDTDGNELTRDAADTWEVVNTANSLIDTPDSEPGDGAAQDDDGNRTLRSAIQEANATLGSDVIRLRAGTYDLTRDGHFEAEAVIGDLDITENLTIIGAGADVTIIDGGALDRIFHIHPDVEVTLQDVTISNGEAQDGGAIFNEGRLFLIRSNITDSRAFNQGGAIYNSGELTIEDSAIIRSVAGSRGGGIFNRGILNLLNVTVSTNRSDGRGGGIFNENSADLTNVTIANNHANGRGGGLANEFDIQTTLANTLITDNTSDYLDSLGVTVSTDFDGTATSLGNNLIGNLNADKIGSGFIASDIVGEPTAPIDAKLAPLTQAVGDGRNGTFRHNLKANSPAIDAGSNNLYPNDADQTDQIGQPRILDGDLNAERIIDIGAKERFLNRPVAVFTISSNPAGVDERVDFDASASSHTNDPTNRILEYEWDFSFDGTTFNVEATGRVVAHRFPTSGSFRVALRVVDDNNPARTDIAIQTIEIGSIPDAPDIVRPRRLTTDSTPTIEWRSGAPEFDIRIRHVMDDGSRPIIISRTGIRSNTFTVPNADKLAPGNYQVEVRAINTAGNSPFSAPYDFRVKQLLLREPQKREVDTSPVIRWTGASGTLRYEVFVKRLDPTPVVEVFRSANIPGDTNSFELPVDLGLGRYRVRVRAYDKDDQPGDWSKSRHFFVVNPVIRDPGAITIDPTPTIRWNNLRVPAYELVVEDTNLDQVVIQQDVADVKFTPTTDLPNSSYRARVRGLTEDGEVGIFSDWHPFVVDTQHLLVPISPIGVSVDRTPTFEWEPVDGVARYDLRVARNNTVIRENNLKEATFTPDTPLIDGDYQWFVRAFSVEGGATPWSGPTDFQIPRPDIFAPVPPINTRTPTIMWTGVPEFVEYELRVDNITDGLTRVISETGITDMFFTPELPLENATFRAMVRGFDDIGNDSDWSRPFDFTIDVTIDDAPILISPIGTITDRTPTFVWTQVPQADTYELLIKEITTGGQPIRIEIKGIDPGAGGTVSFTLQQRLPLSRFRWWVRAVNSNGEPGPYSSPEEFNIVMLPNGSQPSDTDGQQAPESFVAADPGIMVASLNNQLTIHPALAAETPVDTTSVSLKFAGVIRELESDVVDAASDEVETDLASAETQAPAQLDAVMSDWQDTDWWEAEESVPTSEELAADTTVEAPADRRLLLAAAVPFLRRRRNKKKEQR